MKVKNYSDMMMYLTRPDIMPEDSERVGFKDGDLSMTPGAIKQRKYREKNPYKLKTTNIVADGVKYTIPNNAMKPESAKGFIKFLNKLEQDPTIENYGRLVKGLPKDVANQVRNYRYYLQGIKSGSFSGVDRKTGEKLKQLYQELNLPKQSTNLLSKITTKDIKGQVIKTATKAAGEAAKSGSMDVVNAVRDIFVNDPNNAPSLDEVAEGLEGTKKFNAASESERIKMRTKASNAVTQFLGAVTADRKVKGFKDVADETLGDIIQYIDENKRGEFRFAEGQIRNYKIKLRDSLIKGDLEKQRRNIPGQKGKVVDEVFGLSATFENAPGYTENVQIIDDNINKIKRTQIDKPFAAILKAVKEGKEVVQYGGDRNVPISKAVKDFNAKSKTFSNKNKVSTPQIFLGDNLDATKLVSNFKDYSPQAQKNILDLADEGFVLSSTKPSTPVSRLPKLGKVAPVVGAILVGTGAAQAGPLSAEEAIAAEGAPAPSSPLPTALGAGAGAATLGTKTGRSLLGKAFRAVGTPLGGTGFALANIYNKMKEGQSLADAVVDPLTGLELSFPGLFKENVSKIISERAASAPGLKGAAAKLGRGALGFGRFGRLMTPIGLGLAGLGQAQEFYNQYQDLQKMKRDDPESYQQFRSQRVGPALTEEDYKDIYSDVQGAAGGGIMKEGGIESGPQRVSMNPDSEGLASLLKRGSKS